MENDVESRLLLRGGPRRHPGRHPAGVLTGPAGWGAGPGDYGCRAKGTVPAPDTTHSSPWGFRGPLRCIWVCSLARGSWVGSTRYSPPSTHPVYPPGYTHPGTHPLPAPSTLRVTGCANSHFWDTVGEPRGMRTQASINLQNPNNEVLELIEVYTAV